MRREVTRGILVRSAPELRQLGAAMSAPRDLFREQAKRDPAYHRGRLPPGCDGLFGLAHEPGGFDQRLPTRAFGFHKARELRDAHGLAEQPIAPQFLLN